MKADLNLHLVLALCCLIVGNNANARLRGPDGPEPVHCTKGYWTPVTCNGDYNVCISNSQLQVSQSNNKLSELNQEQSAISGRINSCMKQLLASTKTESDRKSDLVQSRTKNEDLKSSKLQLENLRKMEESFFLAIDEEVDKLGEALPQIAIRLNDLIVNQNTKIDLIISDFSAELALTKDSDEADKIEFNIEIFKKLKIAQSKMSSNDPQEFYKLVNQALHGKGDEQVKAISYFDPLTYLILKTVFDNKLTSSGVVGPSELTKQISVIKSNMDNFISKQSSELALEEQKLSQFAATFQDATNDRINKENACRDLEGRSIVLPQLIVDASGEISGSNTLVASCNSYCSKSWIPPYCDER